MLKLKNIRKEWFYIQNGKIHRLDDKVRIIMKDGNIFNGYVTSVFDERGFYFQTRKDTNTIFIEEVEHISNSTGIKWDVNKTIKK